MRSSAAGRRASERPGRPARLPPQPSFGSSSAPARSHRVRRPQRVGRPHRSKKSRLAHRRRNPLRPRTTAPGRARLPVHRGVAERLGRNGPRGRRRRARGLLHPAHGAGRGPLVRPGRLPGWAGRARRPRRGGGGGARDLRGDRASPHSRPVPGRPPRPAPPPDRTPRVALALRVPPGTGLPPRGSHGLAGDPEPRGDGGVLGAAPPPVRPRHGDEHRVGAPRAARRRCTPASTSRAT